MRSALTMLGILIGIAAVMLTVGLGQGAQQQVASQIDKLGSNLLIVSPGRAPASTGVRGGRGSASTLTTADAAMLADPAVAPDIARGGAGRPAPRPSLTANGTNWTTTVVGTTPDWLPVRARTVSDGPVLHRGRAGVGGSPRSCSVRRQPQELFSGRQPGRADRHDRRLAVHRDRRPRHRRVDRRRRPGRPGRRPGDDLRHPRLPGPAGRASRRSTWRRPAQDTLSAAYQEATQRAPDDPRGHRGRRRLHASTARSRSSRPRRAPPHAHRAARRHRRRSRCSSAASAS